MRSFSVRYITKLTKSAASLLRASSTGMCTKEVSAAFRFIENLHCPCVNLVTGCRSPIEETHPSFLDMLSRKNSAPLFADAPRSRYGCQIEALQGSNMQHAHSHFLPLRPFFERADYPKAN